VVRQLDWLCARWLRRYEGDLPVVTFKPRAQSPEPTRATVINTATVAPVQSSPAFISNEHRIDNVYTPLAHTPIADALSKPIVLPDVPKQTVTVQSEWQQQTGNFSVGVEADVDVGKPGGWSVGGKGLWSKATGAAATMYAQWKGKR
jgi:hypothetical protein